MDHVIVDVEIQESIEKTGGWDATQNMRISVACLWEQTTRRMRVYGPDDLEELRARLEKADRVSGFGIVGFDLPVIYGVSRNSPLPCVKLHHDDLLKRIWRANERLGRSSKGWNLDSVCRATLGLGKIGDGKDAPQWWQDGLVHKVIGYCLDDVALERDLCDWIDQHGYVKCFGNDLPLDPWEAK